MCMILEIITKQFVKDIKLIIVIKILSTQTFTEDFPFASAIFSIEIFRQLQYTKNFKHLLRNKFTFFDELYGYFFIKFVDPQSTVTDRITN